MAKKSNIGTAIFGFGILLAGMWLIATLGSFLDKKELVVYGNLWGALSVILIIVGIALAYRELKGYTEESPIEFWKGVYKTGWVLIVFGGVLLVIGIIWYLLIYTQVLESGASQIKLLNSMAIVGGVFVAIGFVIAYFAHNKKIEHLDKKIGIGEKEETSKRLEEDVKNAGEGASHGSDRLNRITGEKPYEKSF